MLITYANQRSFTYQLLVLTLLAIVTVFLIHNINIENDIRKSEKRSQEKTPNDIQKLIKNITKDARHKAVQKKSECYKDRNFDEKLGLTKIEDILLSKRKPKISKTIFFHETTCSKTGILKLNARQACAVESAALLNPNFDIFVLFSSPVGRSNQSQRGIDYQILQALKPYKNIHFRNVNLWRYAENTPSQKWLNDGMLFTSQNLEEDLSDFYRLLTLWRWGGTHLDFDFIVKKTLENIKPNYIGAESRRRITGSIINLNYLGLGHEIANMLLECCQLSYNPNYWGSIGPVILTKIFKRLCRASVTDLMTINRCYGFRVFVKKAFYAVEFEKLNNFFDESYLEETLRLTNGSYAIHFWNKESKHFIVKVGSKVPYAVFAEKYCSKVYSSCGDIF